MKFWAVIKEIILCNLYRLSTKWEENILNLIGTSQNRLHPNESRVNKTIQKLDVVICIPIEI